MMTEFGQHTGPVSDVEFHPHEFLLASASHDRTVNFWDLEKFALVSSTDADTGPIRLVFTRLRAIKGKVTPDQKSKESK